VSLDGRTTVSARRWGSTWALLSRPRWVRSCYATLGCSHRCAVSTPPAAPLGAQRKHWYTALRGAWTAGTART